VRNTAYSLAQGVILWNHTLRQVEKNAPQEGTAKLTIRSAVVERPMQYGTIVHEARPRDK
jgi:hypothetical protein